MTRVLCVLLALSSTACGANDAEPEPEPVETTEEPETPPPNADENREAWTDSEEAIELADGGELTEVGTLDLPPARLVDYLADPPRLIFNANASIIAVDAENGNPIASMPRARIDRGTASLVWLNRVISLRDRSERTLALELEGVEELESVDTGPVYEDGEVVGVFVGTQVEGEFHFGVVPAEGEALPVPHTLPFLPTRIDRVGDALVGSGIFNPASPDRCAVQRVGADECLVEGMTRGPTPISPGWIRWQSEGGARLTELATGRTIDAPTEGCADRFAYATDRALLWINCPDAEPARIDLWTPEDVHTIVFPDGLNTANLPTTTLETRAWFGPGHARGAASLERLVDLGSRVLLEGPAFAPVRREPSSDSPVLGTRGEGDEQTLVGLDLDDRAVRSYGATGCPGALTETSRDGDFVALECVGLELSSLEHTDVVDLAGRRRFRTERRVLRVFADGLVIATEDSGRAPVATQDWRGPLSLLRVPAAAN